MDPQCAFLAEIDQSSDRRLEFDRLRHRHRQFVLARVVDDRQPLLAECDDGPGVRILGDAAGVVIEQLAGLAIEHRADSVSGIEGDDVPSRIRLGDGAQLIGVPAVVRQ